MAPNLIPAELIYEVTFQSKIFKDMTQVSDSAPQLNEDSIFHMRPDHNRLNIQAFLNN